MMDTFEAVLARLADQGWTTVHDIVSPEIVDALAAEARLLLTTGELQRAGIGRTGKRAVKTNARGDLISWIDEETLSPAQAQYWETMEALRRALNRELFLGLQTFEAHYAVYPPGTFYQKHLDRFSDADERSISCVFYLNRNWNVENGGQLRLYLSEDSPDYVEIPPTAGTLVVFRSDTLYHEVLPATTYRFALTGWFRRRSLTNVWN